jgi:Tol biopolymer transport system component
MQNAAGLTWTAANRVLFSEIRSQISLHMAVVTATESRGNPRDVYIPASPTGMAHYAYLSPDGRWVLVVEMDTNGWLPCRLVPFDGSSSGISVGPSQASCLSAAWSPDGRWMYFAVAASGESHLWRQRFPDGAPQQITFGITNDERGVVADPDGRSLITSIGAIQGTVWYHDERGDRQISVEGYAYRPVVSMEHGAKVFYLVRRAAKGTFWIGELWSTDLTSGRNEREVPDFLVRNFDVAKDGRHVVFDAFDASGRSAIWVAPLDRSEPPRRLSPEGQSGEERPVFGPSGDIYYMEQESGQTWLLGRMKPDGTNRQTLSSDRITFLISVSPDERWAIVWKAGNGHDTMALSLVGEQLRALCSCAAEPIFQDSPRVSWSSDGRTMIINVRSGATSGASAAILPLAPGESLPSWAKPTAPSADDLLHLPGAQQVREVSVAPGGSGESYAYTRETQQRNLFRVRLP